MMYACLIVDDEPKAQQVLVHYIEQVPNLHVAGVCKNAFEALTFLQTQKADFLFLDIKMPQFTGLQFARSLLHAPKIIITTAYPDYAVEGFELGVTDYLLKPFSFERFMKAINRAIKPEPIETNIQTKTQTEDIKFIFLKTDANKVEKIMVEDILYIEAYGNYVKVFTPQKMLLVPETMLGMEKILPEKKFMRLHKSYIIPLDKVKSFSNELVQLPNKEIPIGKIYRSQFTEKIKGFK